MDEDEVIADRVKLIKLEVELLYDTMYTDKKDEMVDWDKALIWMAWWLLGVTWGIATALYFKEVVDPLHFGWATAISAVIIVGIIIFRTLRRNL